MVMTHQATKNRKGKGQWYIWVVDEQVQHRENGLKVLRESCQDS